MVATGSTIQSFEVMFGKCDISYECMYTSPLVEINQKLLMWALFVMSFYIMQFYVKQET